MTTVVLLLAGAIAYNVWFFTRDETGGPPAPGGAAGGGSVGAQVEGTGEEGDSVPALFASLAGGLPPLRTEAELAAVEQWRARRPEWGRDPLARSGAAAEGGVEGGEGPPPPPRWRVTAIVRGEGRRTAVIDGRAYSEGERIDGGRVEEIRADEVVIRWRGRLVRVPLREP